MPSHFLTAGKRCVPAILWCLGVGLALAANAVGAQTLASKAKESGCADTPRAVEGSMYRCSTASGASAYFNVPGADNYPSARSSVAGSTRNTPTPQGFPRVDTDTQRGRDDMRRRVLSDELTTEEKLLADARANYANGAPVPLPEEQSNAERYRERIARLRQSVQLHERNIEALKKEIGTSR